MINAQLHGDIYAVTATHATEAVATNAAVSEKTHYVTDISASSDKAGSIILVKNGTTVIWQDIVGAGNYKHTFSTPLRATKGALVSVTIDGTAAAKANIAGFTI